MKIRCLTQTEITSSQRYRTPKGNYYDFNRGSYTEISDPEDALNFLNAGGGLYFEAETDLETAKAKLQKQIDNPAMIEKTVISEEPEVNLSKAEGDTIPIDDTKPTIQKYSYESLKKMTKKEQTDLIHKLDPNAKIDKTEDERINQILDLTEAM